MKRYLVFAFDYYYPGGGWNDFVSAHDTVEEAQKAGKDKNLDCYQIVDIETGEQIERSWRST